MKRKRPHPGILAPGDKIFVPEAKRKSESAASGSSHKFVATMSKVKLRIVLQSAKGEPYEAKRFVVTIDGKANTKGTTASDGLVEVASGARSA